MTGAPSAATSTQGGFPDRFLDDDWREDLRHYAGRGTPAVTILGSTPIVPPTPGPLVLAEIAAVAALVDLRSVEREAEIAKQVDRTHVIAALIRAMGVPWTIKDKKERLFTVASIALDHVKDPIYRLKAHFNRARPWRLDTDLRNMFPKGTTDYPGHPSYPSGHSTAAHTVAFLFAGRVPEKKNELLKAASRIALNRELAGLHFPSDSAAGRVLGEAFARAIVDPPVSHRDQDWLDFIREYNAL